MTEVDLSHVSTDPSEQAKMFTDMIMEKLIKDHVKDYNTCYDHVYKVALEVGCFLIFRKKA